MGFEKEVEKRGCEEGMQLRFSLYVMNWLNNFESAVSSRGQCSLTVVQYSLLQQSLPHPYSMRASVYTGTLLHQPVYKLCTYTTLPASHTVRQFAWTIK